MVSTNRHELVANVASGSRNTDLPFLMTWRCTYFAFSSLSCFHGKWCTVTITDGEGKRYSLDVNADNPYDAAHLFVTHVRNNPSCGFPIPTTSTQFDVVAEGRIHSVPAHT